MVCLWVSGRGFQNFSKNQRKITILTQNLHILVIYNENYALLETFKNLLEVSLKILKNETAFIYGGGASKAGELIKIVIEVQRRPETI